MKKEQKQKFCYIFACGFAFGRPLFAFEFSIFEASPISKTFWKFMSYTLHSKAVNIGVVGIWEGKNFRVDNICRQPGHIWGSFLTNKEQIVFFKEPKEHISTQTVL